MGYGLLENSLLESAEKNIKEFVNEYKFTDRSRIPETRISNLSKLFIEAANMSISFSASNPLSVMETMTIALTVLGLNDCEVSEVLNISTNTVKSHMSRIKIKLGVVRKIDAIIKSLRTGILRVIYIK